MQILWLELTACRFRAVDPARSISPEIKHGSPRRWHCAATDQKVSSRVIRGLIGPLRKTVVGQKQCAANIPIAMMQRTKMRIICISDTHGQHAGLALPDGDVLVHAGDMSGQGEIEEIREFSAWFTSQPDKHKVIIVGNHDFLFEDEPARARAMLAGCHYLQDSSVAIEDVHFYGSPPTPRFFDWAFNQDRGPLSVARWSMIPAGTDVLITHGPPYRILDRNLEGEACGCADLLDSIRRVKPRLHVFGHIHEGAGTLEIAGTTFVNASVLNRYYDLANRPVVIDL